MAELTKEEALSLIEAEFSRAAEAIAEGNQGMLRVCSRRAAGIAIRFWLQQHPRKFWGTDAMNQLRNVQLDQSVPQGVRGAAKRLTSRLDSEVLFQQKSDPTEDSRVIIKHFLGDT